MANKKNESADSVAGGAVSGADMAMAAAAGGNVDKIRDILFGGQMRDYDRRFSRIEDRIAQETTRVRDDFNDRVRDLEDFVRNELAKLGEKLQHERKERSDADDAIGDRLKAADKALNDRVAALDDQTSKDLMDVRNRIRDEARELTEQMRQRFDQLTDTLEREYAHLNDDKVSRDALAGLFTEVAMRLNREFDLSAGFDAGRDADRGADQDADG